MFFVLKKHFIYLTRYINHYRYHGDDDKLKKLKKSNRVIVYGIIDHDIEMFVYGRLAYGCQDYAGVPCCLLILNYNGGPNYN